ncbi:hypothetical protein HPB51_002366 [Rhipicephalus microplus]|uniref:Uncharacterized protein n=1 Tax=Rhipicephalus microplus TaxID=6941 RepID=A0A9J6DSU4_RHIMP|nr:hypothetical protein HPB51_002366 [Rhipicephalus microplus]
MPGRETTSSSCSTESGSIGEDHFPAEVEFTQMTARLLTVSPDFSRIAVVTYSSNYMLHFDHISQGGSSMCGFLGEIEKIGYRGGSTKTKEALEYADRLLQGGRSGVNRHVKETLPRRSFRPPQRVASRNQGVVIFAVGVASINRAELEEVATSTAHIYMLTSFPYIKEVNLDLREDIQDNQWDSVDASKCFDQSGSCDVNAICGCGARGGSYRCICKEGYEGTGTSGTCRPVKCAKLSDPPGGSTLPHPCGNEFGSKCDFKCNEGYCPYSCNMTEVLAGKLPWNSKSEVPRVCRANKAWSGRQFFCDKVRCPALNAPPNGNMNCSSDTFEFGTTCVVWCSVGHNLIGNSSLTCATNGMWIGQLPTCRDVTRRGAAPHVSASANVTQCVAAVVPPAPPAGAACTPPPPDKQGGRPPCLLKLAPLQAQLDPKVL